MKVLINILQQFAMLYIKMVRKPDGINHLQKLNIYLRTVVIVNMMKQVDNWGEISDTYNTLSQITANGEYNNGKKVGERVEMTVK
ncbi:unnamed protein product [Paramecium pentaurelia]|uniref:Uncharacterized protein n=1 Tax=Paramecium pentaurelia TaxID=43138 RepID=A0A8S1UYD8_9CILI|nr:unnamed protein product [Paramecium pentaurelia]